MKKLLSFSLLLLTTLAFVACGGGEQQQEQETTETAMDDGVRTVNVIGTDDLKFVVEAEEDGIVTGDQTGEYFILDAIEASPGEEIRVTLRTESNLPPSAMSHNFILLELGTDADAFSRASITAKDNDYISPDVEGQVITATALLGDGESDSITITVPDEPGEYDFICSFPGHFAGGMRGILVVQ